MHYVYILRSERFPTDHYVSLTDDLKSRLINHNEGGVQTTAKNRPWTLELYIAFRDRTRATNFEKYLKSGSGRAFAKRHFQ